MWNTKRGNPKPVTEAMIEGSLMEATIKGEYTRQTGSPLVGVGDFDLWTHPVEKWLGGSLDDLLADDPAGGLEAKLVADLGDAGYGDPERGEVPHNVRVQVQSYMALTDREWFDVQVCVAPRWHWNPRVLLVLPRDHWQYLAGLAWPVYRVWRNDRLIAGIMAQGREWHERHVVMGEPPDPDKPGDAGMIYPFVKNRVLLATTPDEKDALDRLAVAKAREGEANG